MDRRVVADVGARPAAPAQDGGGTEIYAPTLEDADRAVDVYERGRQLTQHLAERDGVEPVFVWQPMVKNRAEESAADEVSEPTLDMSDILADDTAVFVDGAHTNERGAEIVAERLWTEIAPSIGEFGSRRPGAEPPEQSVETTTTSAAPVSNGQALQWATDALDEVSGDSCAVERWKVWLGSLQAGTPEEVEALVALTQRFLGELTDDAPPGAEEAIEHLRRVSVELPGLAAATVTDPQLPYIPQLPFLADPDSTFLADFETISNSVLRACAEDRSRVGQVGG